jgi:hypothetical protein
VLCWVEVGFVSPKDYFCSVLGKRLQIKHSYIALSIITLEPKS